MPEMKIIEITFPLQHTEAEPEDPPFDWLALILGAAVGVGLGFALCWHWTALGKVVGI